MKEKVVKMVLRIGMVRKIKLNLEVLAMKDRYLETSLEDLLGFSLEKLKVSKIVIQNHNNFKEAPDLFLPHHLSKLLGHCIPSIQQYLQTNILRFLTRFQPQLQFLLFHHRYFISISHFHFQFNLRNPFIHIHKYIRVKH